MILLGVSLAQAQSSGDVAKTLFGNEDLPADLRPEAVGFYSEGCLAGAVAMPVDGPNWQVMRLSRNRNWGHPVLIDFLTTLARDAAREDGWPGLLVGDLAQPRGGPMLSGHASHQIGLDADIWLMPMPDRRLSAREREDISAVPVTEPGPHEVNRHWGEAHYRLIRRAALDPRVHRIFVAPGIKKAMCERAGSDRSWLSKVRPYWGHNYHFHVRLGCPSGSGNCRNQPRPDADDGCGAPLAWWYSEEPYKPSPEPSTPPKPTTLGDLPASCRTVVSASDKAGAMTAAAAFKAGPSSTGAAEARSLLAAPAAAPLPRARPH